MTTRLVLKLLLVALVSAVSACGGTPGGSTAPMTVSSGAFDEAAPIPSDYACDGANHQPPISWSGAPGATKEFALVMDDRDANGFAHWVVVGIPADATALADPLPEGATPGLNGKGEQGYTGPCPPSGTHHYR